jgi:hypothetical protein
VLVRFIHREKQREQVVRLLYDSFSASVASAARAEVEKQAQQIVASVGAMLKSLNGQLMHCIEEVG